MTKRKGIHIRTLIKARGRELAAATGDKEPLLDPLEALKDIKTLARAAQDCADS